MNPWEYSQTYDNFVILNTYAFNPNFPNHSEITIENDWDKYKSLIPRWIYYFRNWESSNYVFYRKNTWKERIALRSRKDYFVAERRSKNHG